MAGHEPVHAFYEAIDADDDQSGGHDAQGDPLVALGERVVAKRVPEVDDQTRGTDRIEHTDEAEREQRQAVRGEPDDDRDGAAAHSPRDGRRRDPDTGADVMMVHTVLDGLGHGTPETRADQASRRSVPPNTGDRPRIVTVAGASVQIIRRPAPTRSCPSTTGSPPAPARHRWWTVHR